MYTISRGTRTRFIVILYGWKL